jgi:hypothetical protein
MFAPWPSFVVASPMAKHGLAACLSDRSGSGPTAAGRTIVAAARFFVVRWRFFSLICTLIYDRYISGFAGIAVNLHRG